MFNETLESSFFFYVFQFMFDKVQSKRVVLVILFVLKHLSQSGTRIRYKNTANFQVKKNSVSGIRQGGEKECYNFVLKYCLLYNFSALKHSDTKDKINLGTSPKFFSCISLFTLGTAFQTEVAPQAESEKKESVLTDYQRVIYLAFLSEVCTLRKGSVSRWFPHTASNTGDTN